MKGQFKNIIVGIKNKEDKVSATTANMINEASEMISFLQELLISVKKDILDESFDSSADEINFFKNIKPHILGKLIYYNKIYRIETACPVSNGKIYRTYFLNHLRELKEEYCQHVCNSDFYRYYRTGRTDRDETYFQLGKINYLDGLNSLVFEIDPHFSTYYDYKVARILANDLLYIYLLTKINVEQNQDLNLKNSESNRDIFWTDSKNALVELIYALYASGAISHGKIGIRKICLIFQILFRIPLNDIHHAFHRMKERTGSRTAFLDQLKASLEDYMDKNL
ncbi:RteC domain-containing protein [Pedobacter metabolipauper]|uniref:RteC protein n=1 Tax=Pedobacter metabolipauper TaxID=425513 RepID=A0A4R6SWJ2_9SPHI|nr:RteC domain-containing protein [Pedobacter metabolipauper]TDQ10210.1 RteC protein [Pedobacter metabolipauper]